MSPASERSARLVLVFACLGHAWFHVLTALFLTLVLLLGPAWQRPYDELIALWTLGALMLGLGAPLAGWCSDRWGETRVMVACYLGMGLGVIACGLATGPLSLKLALALVGLFGAIYHPVGTAWVVKNAKARGKAIGILGVCGGLGAAAASLVAGGLGDWLGWRAAFAIPGVLSLLLGLALLALYLGSVVLDRDSDLAAQVEPKSREVRRAFMVLALTMSLTSVVYYAFTTMLPKWLESEIGERLGDGIFGLGVMVSAIYLVATFAQLIGGHLADRGSAKTVYVVSYALKLAALLLAAELGGWQVVMIAIVVLFMFDVGAPVENVLIARFTPNRRRGLAYGIRNGIAIVAAPLGVQLVAWLFDPQAGFAPLLFVLAGLVGVVLLAALMLPGERGKADCAAAC